MENIASLLEQAPIASALPLGRAQRLLKAGWGRYRAIRLPTLPKLTQPI